MTAAIASASDWIPKAEASRVLVVENSRYFLRTVTAGLEASTRLSVDAASSVQEAEDFIKRRAGRYLVVVTNLTLEGSEDGEVIETLKRYSLPAIILTSHYSQEIRDRVLRHDNVVDYVLKERGCVEQLNQLVERLDTNRRRKVLVVDDSSTMRLAIAKLLKQLRFQTFTAENGRAALEVMRKEHDISLVVTDYDMPEMDGMEFVTTLRERARLQDLYVIGLTGHGSTDLTTRFLKQGANDFIHKPFHREEFFCRVLQGVTLLDYVQELRDAAYRDFLTRLYNRHYFFERAPALWESAAGEEGSIAAAMLDIDHFKAINDQHGHDGGDAALRHMAELIRHCFRDGDLPTRFGGEEFALLLTGVTPEQAAERMEEFRRCVEATPCRYGEGSIPMTVSIGLAFDPGRSLDDILSRADAALYRAKESGRNRVVRETDPE